MGPIPFDLSLPFYCANLITFSLHGAKVLVSDRESLLQLGPDVDTSVRNQIAVGHLAKIAKHG